MPQHQINCPLCGCPDCEQKRNKLRGQVVFECDACDYQFTLDMVAAEIPPDKSDVVPFQKTRCPHCKTTDNKITDTIKGTKPLRRYHYCFTCKVRFTSEEIL